MDHKFTSTFFFVKLHMKLALNLFVITRVRLRTSQY